VDFCTDLLSHIFQPVSKRKEKERGKKRKEERKGKRREKERESHAVYSIQYIQQFRYPSPLHAPGQPDTR
jgi:hypothetical protein